MNSTYEIEEGELLEEDFPSYVPNERPGTQPQPGRSTGNTGEGVGVDGKPSLSSFGSHYHHSVRPGATDEFLARWETAVSTRQRGSRRSGMSCSRSSAFPKENSSCGQVVSRERKLPSFYRDRQSGDDKRVIKVQQFDITDDRPGVGDDKHGTTDEISDLELSNLGWVSHFISKRKQGKSSKKQKGESAWRGKDVSKEWL